jgi:hypothetical protein
VARCAGIRAASHPLTRRMGRRRKREVHPLGQTANDAECSEVRRPRRVGSTGPPMALALLKVGDLAKAIGAILVLELQVRVCVLLHKG